MYVKHNNSGVIAVSFPRTFKYINILINKGNQAEGGITCTIKFDANQYGGY